jgi:hypothetical protein
LHIFVGRYSGRPNALNNLGQKLKAASRDNEWNFGQPEAENIFIGNFVSDDAFRRLLIAF